MLCQFVKSSFVAPSSSVIKNWNIFQKNSVYPKIFYLHSFLLLTSTSLQNLYHCILRNRCRNSYAFNKKNLSSLTRDCSLPIFTSNKTITNLTHYELSQEESDLLKAGLYFSIQPDEIRESKIFTTFEKIHCSFFNNLKSEETKSQINTHHSYLANSYFHNYKPSPRILRQHDVL